MKQFRVLIEANFRPPVKILDVGSCGVNGTYKEIFSDKERFDYYGLDLTPGPNVDYVPSDPYDWQDLPDESFDIIISGQAFEHIEFPWLTILEIKRVLKKGGLICIIAPLRGPEHKYPVDCWRYYPDGFRALARWAGLEVIESRTTWGTSGFKDGSDQWGDTICILRKGNSVSVKTEKKITLSPINKNSPLIKGQPDYYFSIARKEIIELVKSYNLPQERILEIGCAGGATGKLLKENFKIREYVGVDISEEAGVLARQFLDRVIIGDIEKVNLEKEHGIQKGYFDLILCLDVLEHLYNPWDVLVSLREYLKEEGYLIASIPNIQNISVINNLVNGKWEYEKAGILDATHLRFFTKEGIKSMFEGAGLRIEKLDYTFNPKPDTSKIKDINNNIDLGKVMIKNLTRDEVMNLFAYQYIVTSRKSISLKEGKPVIQKDLTSIIILTFNQLEYTKKCVESIKRHTPEPHEVVFVDNGSRDGTVEWLRRVVSENSNYRLIENKENGGFAAGCNQGIREAKGEYILLLNNDVIVTKGWLSGLLNCLKKAPDAGIVGPMTNNISGLQRIDVDYKDESGIDNFARRFSETYRGRRIPLRRIVGFCMLMRRELIESIGLLDESFGTGNFEDDDLCLRAELAGFRNYIAGDVFIHHYGSMSFIGNRIDYNATMGGNRKRFNEKWNAISVDMESEEGKGLLCLRILERAEELYHGGKYEQAIEALIAGLKRQPESKRIFYSLSEKLIELKQYEHCLNILKEFPADDMRLSALKGYCFEGLGNIEEADRIAEEALSIDGDNPLALNLKGIIHFKKEERQRASEYFHKAMIADPGYGEPYTNLGVIKWTEGDKDRAIEFLEKGFKLSPSISDIASLYHSALSQEGLYERAEKFFEEAVRLYPYNRKNTFFLIDVLLKEEKVEKAMDIIEKAVVRFGIDDDFSKAALSVRRRIGSRRIKKNPNIPTLSLCMIVKNEEMYLAQCLESVKGLVDEMVIVDTGSVDRTREIAEIFGARVYEYQWNGDFSEARNFSLSKAEGDWILILDADEVIAERDHKIIRDLIKKNKRNAYQMTTRNYINRIVTNWVQNKGEYLEERGSGWFPSTKTRLFPKDRSLRFENRVHELIDYAVQRRGYRLKPCPVPVHHYGKLNEKKTEEKHGLYYELGKRKLEGADNKPKALLELAIQASEMGRLEEAAGLWEELIRLKPDLGSAYVSLSRVYCEIKRFEDAELASRRAVELAPAMKEAHYARGLSLFYLGRLDEAIESLNKALEIDPDYPLPYGLLSICYTIKGNKEKAKGYIEKVKTMGFDYLSYAHAIIEKQDNGNQ